MTPTELRIVQLVSRNALTANELLDLTWGIAPDKLRDVLARLRKAGAVRKTKGGAWLATADPPQGEPFGVLAASGAPADDARAVLESFLGQLPHPHPHDFDWRFSADGARAYTAHLARYHGPGDSVCVVAAPTLYACLRAEGRFRELSLIERSADTISTIRSVFSDSAGVLTHDLQYPWPPHLRGEFSCIAMDPPWYQDYFELFLSRCVELAREGGFMHTVLFPPFTRATALAERAAILSFAQHHGLSLVELCLGAVEYTSPHFELRSFAESGQDVPATWRRGDIATFFVGQRYTGEAASVVDSGSWHEYRVGRSKLKLRVDGARAYEAPSLGMVEGGTPILRSVSRGYPPREGIGLWTSCQQAYTVQGAHVVQTLLECALDGQSFSAAARKLTKEFRVSGRMVARQCEACFSLIQQIIRKEREYAEQRALGEPAGTAHG